MSMWQYFSVPKSGGGAIIKGCVTYGGNTVYSYQIGSFYV